MKNKLIFIIILLISCGLPPKQKAISILQQGVKDESIIIQVNAAKGLKQTGDAQGIKTLYETLKGKDKNGIAAALAVLYDLEENTFSPFLVKLVDHNDPLIRSEAYKVISLIDDERCLEIFIKGINDKVAKIRRTSFLGLKRFRKKRTIMKGLRDIDPLTRIVAAQALGSIGQQDMENFIRKEMVTQTIDIWKQGIISLAEMGDTSAIPFIKESLVDAPWELRLAAAEALLILNNQDGVDVLKQGLQSNNPFTRVKVVQILKKFNLPEGSQLLKEAVKDEYINVSIVAIEALAKYKAKEHQTLFAEMMGAPNPLVKIAAATAYLQSE